MHIQIMNMILAALLALSTVSDLKARRIPNSLTAPVIIAAVLINTIAGGRSGAYESFRGCGLGLALMMLPFLLKGVGGGDVKLMAAIGALKGTQFVFFTFLFTAVAGGLIVVAVAILKKDAGIRKSDFTYAVLTALSGPAAGGVRRDEGKSRSTIPYACAISAGAAAAFLFAPMFAL